MAFIKRLVVFIDRLMDFKPMDRKLQCKREMDLRMRRRLKEKRLAKDSSCFDPDVLNVAVCGGAKSGKSRLVSAICSRMGQRETKYNLKQNNNINNNNNNGQIEDREETPKRVGNYRVAFWEMPGQGRVGSEGDYFWTNKLAAFDLILVLTGEMLREEQLYLATQLNYYSIPYALIRSKCDRDLRQNATDQSVSIAQIKPLFYKNTLTCYLNELKAFTGYRFRGARCFLISSRCLESGSEELHMDETYLLNFIQGMAAKYSGHSWISRSASNNSIDKSILKDMKSSSATALKPCRSESDLQILADDYFSLCDADMRNRGIVFM